MALVTLLPCVERKMKGTKQMKEEDLRNLMDKTEQICLHISEKHTQRKEKDLRNLMDKTEQHISKKCEEIKDSHDVLTTLEERLNEKKPLIIETLMQETTELYSLQLQKYWDGVCVQILN